MRKWVGWVNLIWVHLSMPFSLCTKCYVQNGFPPWKFEYVLLITGVPLFPTLKHLSTIFRNPFETLTNVLTKTRIDFCWIKITECTIDISEMYLEYSMWSSECSKDVSHMYKRWMITSKCAWWLNALKAIWCHEVKIFFHYTATSWHWWSNG